LAAWSSALGIIDVWKRRRGSAAALEQALVELADAHAELARRQSFTDALL
jgi:hypothetical protein